MQAKAINKNRTQTHFEDYKSLARNDSNNPWTGETSNSVLDLAKGAEDPAYKIPEYHGSPLLQTENRFKSFGSKKHLNKDIQSVEVA